ncbi:MAG TPA: YhgE/Pip domain-containing protein, partial [Pseudogracilibacillus sp.]|nr:YhgE/Pip domain-containing protein [Pseudogracilibacillus sp.]
MREIWNIYRLDLKNIVTNVSVLIVIGGLIFLPSLYAWFNIKASWDPYGQTDQIPVGIVNEDEGATVRGESIDVGAELVTILQENDAMDWQFVDYDKAMSEVEYGNYYAVMVIPANFSEKLATVVSGNPQKAEMEYIVNEKINAIAPKITDKGVSVIVEEISSEFVSTVNGVIFDMFNQIGLELEEEYPDIQQFKEYIFELEESLPGIHDVLTST